VEGELKGDAFLAARHYLQQYKHSPELLGDPLTTLSSKEAADAMDKLRDEQQRYRTINVSIRIPEEVMEGIHQIISLPTSRWNNTTEFIRDILSGAVNTLLEWNKDSAWRSGVQKRLQTMLELRDRINQYRAHQELVELAGVISKSLQLNADCGDWTAVYRDLKDLANKLANLPGQGYRQQLRDVLWQSRNFRSVVHRFSVWIDLPDTNALRPPEFKADEWRKLAADWERFLDEMS
jgi:hypothetical protein